MNLEFYYNAAETFDAMKNEFLKEFKQLSDKEKLKLFFEHKDLVTKMLPRSDYVINVSYKNPLSDYMNDYQRKEIITIQKLIDLYNDFNDRDLEDEEIMNIILADLESGEIDEISEYFKVMIDQGIGSFIYDW